MQVVKDTFVGNKFKHKFSSASQTLDHITYSNVFLLIHVMNIMVLLIRVNIIEYNLQRFRRN